MGSFSQTTDVPVPVRCHCWHGATSLASYIIETWKNSKIEASVHLGPKYNQNLEGYRNTNFEDLKNVFDITERSIFEHEAEILNVSTIGWTFSPWTRSSLLQDHLDQRQRTRLHRFRLTVGAHMVIGSSFCMLNYPEHQIADFYRRGPSKVGK